MIASWIQQIETFAPNELPHRNIWLSWPQAPTKIRDNFSGIERNLAYLEQALKDGGPVYRWIEEQVPPPAPLPIEPQRSAAAINVESDFAL
jgi:hypothetical protein